MKKSLQNKSILLIISGGIAAYKALELIRLLRKSGADIRCILTKGGSQFITPLSVSALSENSVYDDLWSLKDEREMGHIRLTREADLVVIAPASANMIAKITHGIADDLASTTLLASDTPTLIAPAMNHKMWENEATQSNIKTLQNRGFKFTGPEHGDMACNENGLGRMSEPETIMEAIESFFLIKPLKGLKALVTSGPTFEALDPVRFIGNRSSGKQGHAIAQELYNKGAEVTLISGPVSIKEPDRIKIVQIESAAEMLQACEDALPVNIAICAAAVSDWTTAKPAHHKIKKQEDKLPNLDLKETQDILKTLSTHMRRPELVIGFAAETQNIQANAQKKLKKKKCDWILANDVSNEKVFGQNENHVHFITSYKNDDWGKSSKRDIAKKLASEISQYFKNRQIKEAAE